MQSRQSVEQTHQGKRAAHDVDYNSTKHSRRDALAVFWIVNGAQHRFVSVESSQSVSQPVSQKCCNCRPAARMCSPRFEQRPDGGEDNDGKHGEDNATQVS